MFTHVAPKFCSYLCVSVLVPVGLCLCFWCVFYVGCCRLSVVVSSSEHDCLKTRLQLTCYVLIGTHTASQSVQYSAADLGMFRSSAEQGPHKKGHPQEEWQIFCNIATGRK